MSEEFPAHVEENPIDPVTASLSRSQTRSNRMILIGAPTWVRTMIHLLHVARITEVRDWSRMLPTRNANEVISVMQRPRAEK